MTLVSMTAKVDRKPSSPQSVRTVHDQAEENLRYIRNTMESASAFTSISGKGLVFTGLTGLLAAWLELTANQSPSLSIWLTALVIAVLGSTSLTLWKAHRQGTTLLSASGRKLLYAFSPTMLVGGIVTYFLAGAELTELLPGIWLSLYGAAVMTAGAHSIAMIKLVGACFIVLGIAAFALPSYSTLTLALGFGGLHLAAGYLIWRHHGG